MSTVKSKLARTHLGAWFKDAWLANKFTCYTYLGLIPALLLFLCIIIGSYHLVFVVLLPEIEALEDAAGSWAAKGTYTPVCLEWYTPESETITCWGFDTRTGVVDTDLLFQYTHNIEESD